MEDFVMRIIIIGVVSWSALFLFIRNVVFPNQSFEFSNRVVSTCHAVLGVTLAALSITDWKCPGCPFGYQSTTYQMKIITISLAYLIYDMVCCLFDTRPALDNCIHHTVCLVGGFAGLAYQKCGSEMVLAMMVTEVSTPFLHLRELLKELGYKDTDYNLAVDVAFAIIFSIGRMVGGPYLLYVTLSADNPLVIKATALGLQLVCVFWFYKILRMVRYKLVKRSSTIANTTVNGTKKEMKQARSKLS